MWMIISMFPRCTYIWAMAAAGRTDDVAKFLSGLPSAAASDLTGRVFRDVGVPLSEAIVACVKKQYGKVSICWRPCAIKSIGSVAVTRSATSSRSYWSMRGGGRFDLARGLSANAWSVVPVARSTALARPDP